MRHPNAASTMCNDEDALQLTKPFISGRSVMYSDGIGERILQYLLALMNNIKTLCFSRAQQTCPNPDPYTRARSVYHEPNGCLSALTDSSMRTGHGMTLIPSSC